MEYDRYLILNFSHGNGPALRTAELACVINDQRESKGLPRLGIIIPWVYRDRQISIFKENFRSYIKKYPNEFIFDKNFEEILRPIFYEWDSYEAWLPEYLARWRDVEKNVQQYLKNGIEGVNLQGNAVRVPFSKIAAEINRYPIVRLGVRPSYYVSFGYISEILDDAQREKEIVIKSGLLREAEAVHEEIESAQDLHCIAETATHFYKGARAPRYATEILTPPNANQKLSAPPWFVKRGVYVSIPGAPGLERIYKNFNTKELALYTHKPTLLPGSRRASPDILRHKNVVLHFGRIGWGSLWLSEQTQTPFIAMPYDPYDDPEVYFNNKSVEASGLGRVWRGESLDELLEWTDTYKKNVEKIRAHHMQKYGTENGVLYTAEKILKHLE